jgi:pimeloyl-ACP methyl ester carboxylesterase
LVVALHGFGGDHAHTLDGISPASALALRIGGSALTPMAMVTVDGGGGYWHPHPGDDPLGMVVDELIPMCQREGLGAAPGGVAAFGISMGGYGALLLAERYPALVSVVAAISPAIWTTYHQAHSANPGAYASAEDFAVNDVITHTHPLARTWVRVASGTADPFHPGVVALARNLPPSSVVEFPHGCHTSPFFRAQQPLALQYISSRVGHRPA